MTDVKNRITINFFLFWKPRLDLGNVDKKLQPLLNKTRDFVKYTHFFAACFF